MEGLCASSMTKLLLLTLLLSKHVCCDIEDEIIFPTDEEESSCFPGQCNEFANPTLQKKDTEGVKEKIEGTSIFPSTQSVCAGGQAFWPANGQCYYLANLGPCPGSQWLVLNRITDKPECQERPCDVDEALWPTTRTCVKKNSSICQPSQLLMEDFYGEGFCECKILPYHVYWPTHRTCYPLYRQGPCSPGNYIVLRNATNGQEPTCLYNECEEDGLVFFKNACYKLESHEPCTGNAEILSVNVTSLAVECIPNTRYIARIPSSIVCSPGSRLDANGQCRKTW